MTQASRVEFLNPYTNKFSTPTILNKTYTLDLGNGDSLDRSQRQALIHSWDQIVAHCVVAPDAFEVFAVHVRYGSNPQVVHTFAVSTASLYVVGMLPPAGAPQPFPALDYGGKVPSCPLNYEILVTACNAVANAPTQADINARKEFRWVCFLVSEAAREETARRAVVTALVQPGSTDPLLLYTNHVPVINNWMHIAISDQHVGSPSVNRMITREDIQHYFQTHDLTPTDTAKLISLGIEGIQQRANRGRPL